MNNNFYDNVFENIFGLVFLALHNLENLRTLCSAFEIQLFY
jgi:hypothetical protein